TAQTDVAASVLGGLMTAVYNLKVLMAPYTDVGIGYARGAPGDGFAYSRLNMSIGLGIGDPAQDSDGVRTYPCNGTTRGRAVYMHTSEVPDPAPDVAVPLIGTPIFVDGGA